MEIKSQSYFILPLAIFLFPSASLTQNNAVTWYTFDMGYAVPMSSTTTVKSAVGQIIVGTSELADTRIESGLLADSLNRGPIVSIPEADEMVPLSYVMNQNYPNPFNPSTTICYEIPKRCRVDIRIYSILGQQVAVLVSEVMEAGRYNTVWNGRSENGLSVGSGVYFYRIQAVDFVETKKLILLK